MDIGQIIQIVLFVLAVLALLAIIVGVAKAVPRPHKVKAYRYSKKGDDWIQDYDKRNKAA